MARADDEWVWEIELEALVGRHCYLETEDGMQREGKITGIRTRPFRLAGDVVQVPLAIELNGDPRDLIEFLRLKKVDIQ